MDQGAGNPAGLASLIRAFRHDAGLTQHELARRAGLSLGSVRDLEQGRTRHPLPGSLKALATALGLSSAQTSDLERAATGRGLEVQVLGPLAAWLDGAAVSLGGPAQRAVFGLLALSPGLPVQREALIDLLWPDNPPVNAANLLQTHISRLRKSLGSGRLPGDRSARASYRLQVGPGQLDLLRFGALTADARAAYARGDYDGASTRYEQALGLWRGAPLADVDLLRGHPEVTNLDRQHAEAAIDYARAASAAGRGEWALAPLRELISREPLNERAHAQLMITLAGCGQQAEALAVYHDVHRRLDEELAIPPSQELAAAHQRVLRQEATAAPVTVADGSGAAVTDRTGLTGWTPPRQLPATVACFTGRQAELAALTGLLAAGAGRGVPAMVISAIGGAAGVGKTALAVAWAHKVAERFPDGQLYVNLRGYDPAEPLAAADALAGLLRSLGIPGAEIPDGVEERSRLYRSRLAGRRVLVLLDNACDSDQVRPLLPGDPDCVAVVTSRDQLAGLVAADGARRLDLDLLPMADAVALLRSLIGAWADDDKAAATELAGLCARLPLALRIAAELVRARRPTPLAELVAELAGARLDGLDAGEDRADIRTVFSWSYRYLPGEVAEAFMMAGLHPGEDLDVPALAALTGTTARQARQALGRLHRASLIQTTGPGRYAMHDLLRAYAREQAFAGDANGICRRALTRLFDYYRARAAAAMDLLFPADAHRRPHPAATDGVWPAMTGQAEARAWLDQERANLVAVVIHCAGGGWPGHAADLAAILYRYLVTGSRLVEADMIYGHAVQAARQSGDLAAEASALNGLGSIDLRKGRFRAAAGYYQAALEGYRRCGDRAGEGRVLDNLGTAEQYLHNYRAAADCYREAIAAYEDAEDSLGVAVALCYLSGAEIELGSLDQAAGHLQLALQVFREAQDPVREAEALGWIGELNLRRGDLTQAASAYGMALAIYRRIEHPVGVAAGFGNLGEVSLRQSEYQQAISYLRQAVALFRQIGDQYGETMALRNLAEALHGIGQPAAARVELAAALSLAAGTGNTYQQAGTHHDLAESYHRAGQDERARDHWQQALTLYTRLGAAEADRVRSRLSHSSRQQGQNGRAATDSTCEAAD
jgi:DNA-binding SARP family transcriptional activator/DNA-binding XRE family transcriptional regulator